MSPGTRVATGTPWLRASLASPDPSHGTIALALRQTLAVADFNDVRRIGTTLPGVEESTSYGTPALKVRGKSFCRMWSEREHNRDDVHDTDVLVVMCDVDEKAALIDAAGGVLFSTPHYEGYGAMLVRLVDVSDDDLADYLEDASAPEGTGEAHSRVRQVMSTAAGTNESPAHESPTPESPTHEWVTATPAPHVAPFVERYLGYRIDGFEPCVHHGLPSRFMTFIVSIGDSIDVLEHSDSVQRPGRYRGVLAGLTTAPTLIASPGHEEGVAIELTPLGFRRLLAMPARELWNSTYECAEVVGGPGDELWERLQIASTWAARFAVCDDILGRLRPTVAAHSVGPELSAAWNKILLTGGTVRTADLAADTGWSRQHLTRQFRAEFGTGPKSLARVVRFERAVDRLRNAPARRIADVAAECGYFDQAHLDRDFATLAGCSPTTLLYEDVPSFQADAVLDPA